MKKLFSILLLFPLLSHAQQYTRAEIKHAADSIMHTFLRPDMFAACKSDLDNDHYVFYSYENTKGKTKSAEVPRQPTKYTKGKFKSVIVPYNMKYRYQKCKTNDIVEGMLWVTLDRYLDMKKAPDIAFIPDYMWENDSCSTRSYSGR